MHRLDDFYYSKVMKKNGLILCLCTILAMMVSSCEKDLFDLEKYKELVKEAFPIAEVDENHTWTTMGTLTSHINVVGDYGKQYVVGVYLENPLVSNEVTTLYKDTINGEGTIEASFSYPLSADMVYIGVFDPVGRRVVEVASINNGRIEANIGGSGASSRMNRASESEWKDSNPAYAKPMQTYLKSLTIDAMKNYTALTDAVLTEFPNGNHTLNDRQYRSANGEWYGGGDGHHYRVPAGTTLNEPWHIGNGEGEDAIVVYVEGKMIISTNNLNAVTIVVGNGGEIVLNGNIQMSTSGRFVVAPGGKITGRDHAVFSINNAGTCYNAGEINFNGTLRVNGSDFYNCGIIDVDVLTGTSGGTTVTNFGSIKARTNMMAGETYNGKYINGCSMAFTENAGVGQLVMLNNSKLECGGKLQTSGTVKLYTMSQIITKDLHVQQTYFEGPTAGGDFSIVKISNDLYCGWSGDLTASGNVYFDWGRMGDGLYVNGSWQNLDNEWSVFHGIKKNMTKLVSESSSSLSIPESDCAGAGFSQSQNDASGNGSAVIAMPEEKPLNVRFCFEDNFPQPGDYDFNDLVITVTPENLGWAVALTVTLDAVGAKKQLAAALRLKNIKRSEISNYWADGSPFAGVYDYPWQSGMIVKNNYNLCLNDAGQSTTDDFVLFLFNDAHYAMNRNGADALLNGSPTRQFYNTIGELPDPLGRDIDPVTVKFYFQGSTETLNKFTADNFDLFLVEEENGTFWEIHTYPFKFDQIVREYAGKDMSNYQDPYPWGIAVPGNSFKYPKEWMPIGMYKNQLSDGAYNSPGHAFVEWAADHTTALDWYKYPSEGTVYERH